MQTLHTRPIRHLCCLSALTLFSLGCSFSPSDQPDLGSVKGMVTIDGKPMNGYTISFAPETGRPSFATIDAEGNYELNYIRNIKGAKVGLNTVKIWWVDDGDPATTAQPIPGVKIPKEYLSGTEVTRTVEAGSNTFDFELQTN